ncbi:hypothetical protein LOTGIDRAFT_171221 [Lottia gigantea]|uniref:Torsin-1A C-terminal domain-containing protein n=1 Tax=Lottia gigantea TaxID=225164 RepID=V4B0L4_LOTGI|nr:hypothetical protein LOTGIDRAFT_171221 [Lottia gigantea]ESP03688.1 hypothetical protein LOTGIDRAFT_171221 [Lottia gigantea]
MDDPSIARFADYLTEQWFEREDIHNYLEPFSHCLQTVLQDKLYGQHLVLRAVVNHVRAHFENKHPPKALTLSFHGGIGTGKSYTAKIIADHLFKGGMTSPFVHLISASKEFRRKDMIDVYRDQIHNWIETNISVCSRSLFIFDEMDKMPAGLLDTIKPYLDFYQQIGGIDYRKATFLFLSNSAGRQITDFTYKQLKSNVSRESIKLKDMQNIILNQIGNEDISRFQIIIPFLPLEKRHVKRCIQDAMEAREYFISESIVQEVMDEIVFYPQDEKIFTVTGCKKVSDKMEYVMFS